MFREKVPFKILFEKRSSASFFSTGLVLFSFFRRERLKGELRKGPKLLGPNRVLPKTQFAKIGFDKIENGRLVASGKFKNDVVRSAKTINPLRGGGAEAPRPQSAVEARASIQCVDGVLGELQSFLFSLDVRKRWSA